MLCSLFIPMLKVKKVSGSSPERVANIWHLQERNGSAGCTRECLLGCGLAPSWRQVSRTHWFCELWCTLTDSLWAPTGAGPVQKTEASAFKMIVNRVKRKNWILSAGRWTLGSSWKCVSWLCFAFWPVPTLPSSKECWSQLGLTRFWHFSNGDEGS